MPTATAEVRLTLRDYQDEALQRVQERLEQGVRRQLGVAATGLGKTIMFCALAERMGCRALILAHRDELINQAAAKVREVIPGVEVGICKAQQNDVTAHIVVGSVQTLGRPARLARLVAAMNGSTLLGQVPPFGLLVIDEAHHARADSYGRIIEALHAGEPDGPLLLGVTATPDRGDGKGLHTIFDEVVFSYDILYGIRAGYLSDLRGLAVTLSDFDTSNVKVTGGDYNAGHAGALMEKAHAPELIVKAWQQHAADRRTLVFTPTVALAQQIAHEYNVHGVAAGWVSGETPLELRRDELRQFESGELQVMVNCAVLTEGYDNPRVDCVVIARPTQSRALYVQMVGRGTRRHPDKADCLVIDVVGATADHSLVTIPSLFGLEKQLRDRAGDGGELLSSLVQKQHDENKRLGKLTAREVALFESVRRDGIAWVQISSSGERARYIRPLGRDEPMVVLAEVADGDDGWTVGLQWPDGRKQALMRRVPMEMAQGIGEDYVRKQSAAAGFVDAAAKWRSRPATPKQRGLARRWHLKVDPKWNAGELSDAIDAHIARIRARKAAKK